MPKRDTKFKKGHVMSPEVREKIANANRGKKKPPRTLEHKRKIREHLLRLNKGRIGKKRPPMSLEWRKNLIDSHQGINLGIKRSKETREKMSIATKGRFRNNPFYRQQLRIRRLKQKFSYPFKDTSIERLVENELIKRNINYQKQVPLCRIAIVDFYLPEYRIVIQCDGDYWHSPSVNKGKDKKQDAILTFNGFNVYRFWEHEINECLEKCFDRLPI